MEEDDIEEDDFEEDTNFCSGKIPFNIKCEKNRINNFVTQFYEISHSISIARIRINNFVTQLDEIPY